MGSICNQDLPEQNTVRLHLFHKRCKAHARHNVSAQLSLIVLQETQTKPEGQIHFFPVLFDGREVSAFSTAFWAHVVGCIGAAHACSSQSSGHACNAIVCVSSPQAADTRSPAMSQYLVAQEHVHASQVYNVMVERCGDSQTSLPAAEE